MAECSRPMPHLQSKINYVRGMSESYDAASQLLQTLAFCRS
jgi:hypothetical protein